ncbi:MAG TPA: chemotaxis protein CheB [Candidatus Binatia bacterium]|nr:chemotaxis protein CheB [Candidatus Binatia bacterium]
MGSDEPARASSLTIVGVGTSAGGLEAASQLLHALPRNPGFAMVIVQHLAPQHESALPALLGAHTGMQVVQATEGMRVEKNHVYVIPPNVQMGIVNDQLHLGPRPTDRSQYTPVDFFLRCLAEAVQERAVAVILSGTASDGAAGVREVKAAGGIAIAQKPDTARYDGMPRAAIATGAVDLVLAPEEIARELVRLVSHPLRRRTYAAASPSSEPDPAGPNEDLEQIFGLIRSATGVDFRRYKRPTIERRLSRRMLLHRLTATKDYVKLLRENPAEVTALYQDILIHVTRFFREPESFAAIVSHVLPRILEQQRDDQPIRVWVPGCSTGEEAYSIAILILEYLGERASAVPVQVFATDVSEAAIDHARAGVYPESIVADVSAERLRRFFVKGDGAYRVTKAIRDLCIFARQDLTRDPPFSRIDLVLCRNVLIYMGAELQKRLMVLFHYALKPTGFLVIGGAETVGPAADLFTIVDKTHRIYARKLTAFADMPIPFDYARSAVHGRREPLAERDEIKTAQGEANRVIQERYAPPGVLVDGSLRIVQFRGQTGAYLEPAPGDPSVNLLKMAREGLLHDLRAAVQQARRTRASVRRKGVRVRAEGAWRVVTIEVHPLNVGDRPHLLVLFDEGGRPAREPEPPAAREHPLTGRGAAREVARLNQELASSREYLQSIIQELEAANEELQSANEEVLSANEELQSTNEELDTAKEELQSTNEELNTVNEELQGRNEELSRLNSDLMNLLGSVQIAIVIVGRDLSIRRFTPMAERILNLRPSDIGRTIAHIKPNIDCPDLEERITAVVDDVQPLERTVTDRQGNSFLMRIRPYTDVDNRIDGAVLALVDVNPSADQHSGERRPEYLEGILHVVRHPLAVLDGELRIRTANEPFRELLGIPDGDAGRRIDELGDGRWVDAAAFQTHLQAVVAGEKPGESFEMRHEGGARGAHTVRVNAWRIGGHDDGAAELLVAVGPVDPAKGSGRPRGR